MSLNPSSVSITQYLTILSENVQIPAVFLWEARAYSADFNGVVSH